MVGSFECASLHFLIVVIEYVYARVAQLVEYDLAKVGVAGSSPVSRSFLFCKPCFQGFFFYIEIYLRSLKKYVKHKCLCPKIIILLAPQKGLLSCTF